MPVDPHLQGLLDLIDAAPYPPLHEGTPETARKAFRAITVDAVRPEQVIPVASATDSEVAGVPVRVYRPSVWGPVPTVLFLHGGGFVVGDLDTHDNACRRLCRDLSAVVVSVDYRLAPEHPFPAAVDDAVAVASYVAGHLAGYGGSDRLGVAGDSAGGNLSAVVTQAVPGICAQLLVYPATDVFGEWDSRAENGAGYFLELATMAWFFGHYASGSHLSADDPRHSPLRRGTLAGLPPAVVATAEFDPLRDEGEAYAAALREAGVPVDVVRYDAMIHGFLDMGMFSPSADEAVRDLIARFRPVLHHEDGVDRHPVPG